MEFIHPSTGLLIQVHKVNQTENHTDFTGHTKRIITGTQLETECGQKCTPATAADHHELLQVDVHVGKSQAIRLIRQYE